MIPAKTPKLVSRTFKSFTWAIPNQKNEIFLTFDDGPIPEVTPWILDVLKLFGAKATFFCVGENVDTHISILNRILDEGHSVGNHTYNHFNAWHMSCSKYVENVMKAQKVLKNAGVKSKLFRPPYGKLMPLQSRHLTEMGFEIILWDVLSKDYSEKISATQVQSNILNNVTSGSIIVCHDNIKSFSNLRAILEQTIHDLLERGFVLKAL